MASLWAYASIFLLRPVLAVSFALSLVLLSWWVAWKTVLVHVPLVQEIFGLRKKPPGPALPPPTASPASTAPLPPPGTAE